jgi:hypothetical protein
MSEDGQRASGVSREDFWAESVDFPSGFQVQPVYMLTSFGRASWNSGTFYKFL